MINKRKFIVLSGSHYDVDGSKGASLTVLTESQVSNPEHPFEGVFGLLPMTVDADFAEVKRLESFSVLPCVCELVVVEKVIKSSGGKPKMGNFATTIVFDQQTTNKIKPLLNMLFTGVIPDFLIATKPSAVAAPAPVKGS